MKIMKKVIIVVEKCVFYFTRRIAPTSFNRILHFPYLFSGVIENTLMIREVPTGQPKPKEPFPVTYLKFSNWPAKEIQV